MDTTSNIENSNKCNLLQLIICKQKCNTFRIGYKAMTTIYNRRP